MRKLFKQYGKLFLSKTERYDGFSKFANGLKRQTTKKTNLLHLLGKKLNTLNSGNLFFFMCATHGQLVLNFCKLTFACKMHAC